MSTLIQRSKVDRAIHPLTFLVDIALARRLGERRLSSGDGMAAHMALRHIAPQFSINVERNWAIAGRHICS